ncbi:MAG: hypothetical protein EHM21_14730, partial [Chloroflexi bacterium]
MKSSLYRRFLLIFIVLFLVTSACAMPLYNQTPTEPNNAETLAVQTIDAMMTQISGSSVTVTPLDPGQPSPTGPAPTVLPSSTPIPTFTQVILPTATATPVCNMAAFMADVTIPDGTNVLAGTQFVKTWRIRNEGTCAWTPDYAAVFDSGDAMGAPPMQPLGVNVAPGQTVDISVTFTAPPTAGEYRSNWKLRASNGVIFGLGTSGTGKFYVVVKVTSATLTGSGLNFATNVCSAVWTGNNNSLPCNGTDNNPAGFVLYKPTPLLETGYQDDEPGVITNPPYVIDGIIRGKYPAYTVKDKDHFTAIIGCEYNAKKCNVRFQLEYQIDNGAIQTLATWNEAYDENFSQVNVDLSSLAGKKVNFILTVL